MATKQFSDTRYRATVLSLYALGIGLNLWLAVEVMKQTEEGQEILAQVKSKTFDRVKSFKDRFFSDLSAQVLILEAEELVKRAYYGQYPE